MRLLNIRIELGYAYAQEIKALFAEYTKMLVDNDKDFADYLKLQKYDDELEHLDCKYGIPQGRLFILFIDDEVAGCVALKPRDESSCELKRLYIRPHFRGHDLGALLVQKIIDSAREIGYERIILDTLPFLKTAIKLYHRLGFETTNEYTYSPMDTSIYMKMDLK